jgi:hypothetical protein
MIRVKNWSKYQSYKDRRPPWIRFHRTILDDFTFQSMSAEARAFLPMLWLLACEHEDPVSGLIPYSYEEIEFRLRMRNGTVTKLVQELQTADFITCIESVTKPLQNRNETVPPETETETETERKGRFAPPSISEVSEYIKEKGYSIDPQQFVDFYAAKGWMVGSNKMKDWKASVRTWVNRDRTTQKQNTTTEVWKNAI